MIKKPFPGYEGHFNGYVRDESRKASVSDMAEEQRMSSAFDPQDSDITIKDYSIPSSVDGENMTLRIFIPQDVAAPAPMILDVHGGGFVGGSLDMDNYRCANLAEHVHCIVASVDYHLATKEVHFPTPVMDAYQAYVWLMDHGSEFGGDGSRIGLHGSSAGATICSGLALYLRDHGPQQPSLTVLNCPCIDTNIQEYPCFYQNFELRMGEMTKNGGAEDTYLGGFNGGNPNAYAFPGQASDVGCLGPHFIIAAEYDTLRDGAMVYANRLLKAGVPTEVFLAGRMAHCFTAWKHPYTDLINEVLAASYRREFNM